MSAEGSAELEGWEHLNREALLALGLARPSIIGPIVNLLRSKAPLDPIVRNAIADALEGLRPDGPHFVVKGTGRGAHFGKSLANFRRDIAIARHVASSQAAGMTYEHAIREVAKQFRESEKTCERAITATNKMDNWMEENPVSTIDAFPEDLWRQMCESRYWALNISRQA